ncbi:MAG TPA: GNAT family N-acetyltransferase [Dongiaceae bacterium]|nr:GNAT family N-acetyltransferase [Dongiaceae bacterium]
MDRPRYGTISVPSKHATAVTPGRGPCGCGRYREDQLEIGSTEVTDHDRYREAGGIEIERATAADIDGILDLQARNQPARGGTLSHSFPRASVAAMIAAMPVIVARREGRVVGYLMSAPLSATAEVPILQAMLTAYRGTADAYVYGPICVAAAERGHGLAGAMFAALRQRLPGREGILFIRRDNAASRAAHEKMGIRRVGEFSQDGVLYDILSSRG